MTARAAPLSAPPAVSSKSWEVEVVADAETGQTLRRWDVPQPSARRAIALCQGWDAQLMLFTDREILVNASYKKYLEAW